MRVVLTSPNGWWNLKLGIILSVSLDAIGTSKYTTNPSLFIVLLFGDWGFYNLGNMFYKPEKGKKNDALL